MEPFIIDFNISVELNSVSHPKGSPVTIDPYIYDNNNKSDLIFSEYNDIYALGVILY